MVGVDFEPDICHVTDLKIGTNKKWKRNDTCMSCWKSDAGSMCSRSLRIRSASAWWSNRGLCWVVGVATAPFLFLIVNSFFLFRPFFRPFFFYRFGWSGEDAYQKDAQRPLRKRWLNSPFSLLPSACWSGGSFFQSSGECHLGEQMDSMQKEEPRVVGYRK